MFKTIGMKFALFAVLGAASASMLFADTMVVTYSPAKTQTPVAPTTATFTPVISTGVATGSITGVYAGKLSVSAANQYGGAGGTGDFASVSNGTYTLMLSTSGSVPGVNYFGLWFSALDAGNKLTLKENGTTVYTFTPQLFSSLVGACPSGVNQFCGNPNSGQDSTEQFAFLNFYDMNGFFNEVDFTETSSAGFESDNHTVGYMNPVVPTGTVVGATPEPGSIVLLLTGCMALIGVRRRFALSN
jgi:hypothetical protein